MERPEQLFSVLMLASLTACGSSGPAPPPKLVAASCEGESQAFSLEAEAQMAAAINGERVKAGIPALRPDPELTRIARARACDIVRGSAFSHTDAQGNFIAAQMVNRQFGPNGVTGENIIESTEPFDAERFSKAAVADWMESPEHRANILNIHFEASGIGVAKIGADTVATQVFYSR
jgi:uncharacterized protein YkwD